MLGALGYRLGIGSWSMVAFLGSGAIFPVAVLLAKLFRNPFLKDRTATGDVLVPAFIAIGMSLHWPVIGWSYGRTALFSAHAIVRALTALGIWLYVPGERLTLLPLAVAGIYLATVVAILIDSAIVKVPEQLAD